MTLNGKLLAAGMTLILGVNAIVLSGVAYNRAGEPEAVVELTARELTAPYQFVSMRGENTGLTLQLNYRMLAATGISLANYISYSGGSPEWLDRDKLLQLGFALDDYEKDKDKSWLKDKILAKETYVVLEYDGKAYQQALVNAEKNLVDEKALRDNNPDKKEFERRVKAAETRWQNEQNSYSRLFVIDAGTDKAALHQKYTDRHRYIILQGLIRPVWQIHETDGKHWSGTISDIQVTHINVPLSQRQVLMSLEDEDKADNSQAVTPTYSHPNGLPRFKTHVAFGKRGEPWLMDVEAM